MHKLILCACLGLMLVGCGPTPEPVGYRTRPGMIASAALFDPARFQGDWHVVAAFAPEAACGALQEAWSDDGPGRFLVRGAACSSAGLRQFATRAVLTGPGRISRIGAAGPEEMWVLWVDADYRIAAIGTPSGRFGRILARDAAPRADLLRAAQTVLDFNGYDISGLKILRKP